MSDDHFGSLIKIDSKVVIKQCDKVLEDIGKRRGIEDRIWEEWLVNWFKKRHRFANKGSLCRRISRMYHGGDWFVKDMDDTKDIINWLQKYCIDNNLTTWNSRARDLSEVLRYKYPCQLCSPWYDTAKCLKDMANAAAAEGPNEFYVYIGSEDYKTIFGWGKK